MSSNPLRQFFRQPAAYIRLPSDGKYYPKDTVVIPENREFPVYPMTAIDEITYRTPDALFNGTAVVNVIHSCVPNIKNAWAIPSTDIDTILVAIRMASYGNEIDLDSTCPACQNEMNFQYDLRTVLDRLKAGDYTKPLRFGDLEIFLRPMNYKELNDNNASQFEEQRIIQQLPDSDLPDNEKLQRLNESMKKITALSIKIVAQSVGAIRTPESLVQEPNFIMEFLTNCPSNTFNAIRDHAIELKAAGELQPIPISCNACQHEYKQTMTLDMVNFFAPAS